MRALLFATLAGGLLLSACSSGNAPPTQNPDIKAISLGDGAKRCITQSDVGIQRGSYELAGDLRARMLTPQAAQAGVRVFVESSQVSTYGSQTVYYVNASDNCLLWAEGLTLQEFSQRLGLNPVGISPAYEATPAPATTPAVAPAPAPAATPTVATPAPAK